MSERIDPGNNHDHRFIVSGRATEAIYETMKKYALYADTILLIGETGVGKDLIARELHRLGKRSDKPYIPVPLTALSETLLESELFGHEKGSFTGADRDKTGIFEAADGGVLYFPEISELPEQVQIKLLHFIQYRTFRRVGHHPKKPEIRVDVCLIFATNEDPEECVRRKKIRSDFYYRINKHQIVIPALKERLDEIGHLADYFSRQCGKRMFEKEIGISKEAIKYLQKYHWLGNVRELEGVIERTILNNMDSYSDDVNKAWVLPEHIIDYLPNNKSGNKYSADNGFNNGGEFPDYESAISESEKAYIHELLNRADGSLPEAVRIAGFSLKTLRRKMKKHGVMAGK